MKRKYSIALTIVKLSFYIISILDLQFNLHFLNGGIKVFVFTVATIFMATDIYEIVMAIKNGPEK